MSQYQRLLSFIGTRQVSRDAIKEGLGDVRRTLARAMLCGDVVLANGLYTRGERKDYNRGPWTPGEIAALRIAFPQGIREAMRACDRRSYDAIRVKAIELGLTRRAGRPRQPSPTDTQEFDLCRMVATLPAFGRGNLAPVVRTPMPEAA
jgi:hypothetical protein